MKFFGKLIAFLLLSSLFNFSVTMRVKTQRITPKEGCVIIYKDCNYEGPNVEICEDQSDFRIINFRDQASAITLGKNVKAEIFQEKNFGGQSTTITRDESCFEFSQGLNNFNDKVNSLKVINISPSRPPQGCVRIFENCYYKGKSYQFCNDRPIFPKKYFDSTTVSSFWLGENTELQLYMDIGLRGQSKSFSQDFDCLGTCVGWMTNNAKSASVFTVVRTQKKFTEEEMKKLEEEEKKEEEKKLKESQPDFFNVVYASYGLLDITEKIKSLINIENHSLTFSAFNDSFGSTLDGVFKTSHVIYWSKGKICVAGVKDQEILDISVEKEGYCYDLNYTQQNLKIYAAIYGGKDVTSILRNLASSDSSFSTIEPKVALFGFDPLPGWKKTFSIFYEIDGIKVISTILDGGKLVLIDEATRKSQAQKAKEDAEKEIKAKQEKDEQIKKEAKAKAEEEERRKKEEENKRKLDEKMKFSIVEVNYGPFIVTDEIRKRLIGNSVEFKIYNSFPTLPEDYLKMATIFYWENYKICARTIKGDESVRIDDITRDDDLVYCNDPPTSISGINIFKATFGGSDITNLLRNRTNDPKFTEIRASSHEFGKPLPGWQNPLFVYYKIGDTFIIKLMLENEKINFYDEIQKSKIDEENKKKELEKAIQDAKNEQENKKYMFSIVGVSYGPMDFTEFTKGLVKDDSLSIKPYAGMFGDSWSNMKKTLHIVYWYQGKICIIGETENNDSSKININNQPPNTYQSKQEISNEFIVISKNDKGRGTCHSKLEPNSGAYVTIHAAVYGITDVTEQMRIMFNSKTKDQSIIYIPNLIDFKMDNIKDGLISRTLSVYFSINNVYFFVVITDGQTLDFLKIYESWSSDKNKENIILKKAEIILAHYGDLRITDRVRRIVELTNSSRVVIKASNSIFGDPSPYLLKTASIIYKINGKFCITNALENENLVIEENDNQCYNPPNDDKSRINIYVAGYAGLDITDYLRLKMIQNGTNKLPVSDAILHVSNLDYRWLKMLIIYYVFNGQTFAFIMREGTILDFIIEEDKRNEKEKSDGTYFKISHASYGPLEVTEKIKLMTDKDNNVLTFRPENKLFGDSWVGNSPKYSHVFYLLHDKICVANAVEYGVIDIGIGKRGVCYEEPATTKSGIKIEAASWGDRDVTEYLRKMSFNPMFNTVYAEDSFFGDTLKTLSIQFVVNGKRFNKIIKEHENLNLIQYSESDILIKIKQAKAEEELRKKIVSMSYATKAKEEIIAQANLSEKQKLELIRQQEEETSHMNEEKIALISQQKTLAAEKLLTTSMNNDLIARRHSIERKFLSNIKLRSTKGTVIKNKSEIVITHVKTGAKLYISNGYRNTFGNLLVSGYTDDDIDSNIFWEVHSNKPVIQNFDTIKLKHRDTRSYLSSIKDKMSNLSGNQELLGINSGLNTNTDWKIIIVHNYSNNNDLKVGDVFKLKHINSDRFLSTSDKLDSVTNNKQTYVNVNESTDNDFYVISEVK